MHMSALCVPSGQLDEVSEEAAAIKASSVATASRTCIGEQGKIGEEGLGHGKESGACDVVGGTMAQQGGQLVDCVDAPTAASHNGSPAGCFDRANSKSMVHTHGKGADKEGLVQARTTALPALSPHSQFAVSTPPCSGLTAPVFLRAGDLPPGAER